MLSILVSAWFINPRRVSLHAFPLIIFVKKNEIKASPRDHTMIVDSLPLLIALAIFSDMETPVP